MYKKLFLAAVAGMLCNLPLSAAQKSRSEVEQKTRSAVQSYDANATKLMWDILTAFTPDLDCNDTDSTVAQLLHTLFANTKPDINAGYSHWGTPIIYATQRRFVKFVKVVQFLIAHTANVNIPDSTIGWTPLMHAAQNKDMKMIQILIAAGADKNVQSFAGKTAQHYAQAVKRENEYLQAVAAGEAELKAKNAQKAGIEEA